MSMQKGGVNSDTLAALSSSPTTATTTTTSALAGGGGGGGGGTETNNYADEGSIVAPAEEPNQAAVEEHVESAEASI